MHGPSMHAITVELSTLLLLVAPLSWSLLKWARLPNPEPFLGLQHGSEAR